MLKSSPKLTMEAISQPMRIVRSGYDGWINFLLNVALKNMGVRMRADSDEQVMSPAVSVPLQIGDAQNVAN